LTPALALFLAAHPSPDGRWPAFKLWAKANRLSPDQRRACWRQILDATRDELNAGVDTITGYLPPRVDSSPERT
jgi:hypothetical protein